MKDAIARPGRPLGSRRSISRVAVGVLLGLLTLGSSGSTLGAGSPTLTIVAPSEGSLVANGTPVIVSFLVSNFLLVQPGRVGQIPTAGEGHANVYLDEQYVRLSTDLQPFALTVTSGPHTIRIQLVGNDGVPLSPDVSASVQFSATQGPAGGVPAIVMVGPSPLEKTGHDVYVTVRISNFTLAVPRGQPNAPGEGRLQILVEGIVVMEVTSTRPILLVALPDGDITITARLVNNDGGPLSPDVSAAVQIHVSGSSYLSMPLILDSGVTLLLAFILVVLILRRRHLAARNARAPRDDT